MGLLDDIFGALSKQAASDQESIKKWEWQYKSYSSEDLEAKIRSGKLSWNQKRAAMNILTSRGYHY